MMQTLLLLAPLLDWALLLPLLQLHTQLLHKVHLLLLLHNQATLVLLLPAMIMMTSATNLHYSLVHTLT